MVGTEDPHLAIIASSNRFLGLDDLPIQDQQDAYKGMPVSVQILLDTDQINGA